jgi:hypothetical protein
MSSFFADFMLCTIPWSRGSMHPKLRPYGILEGPRRTSKHRIYFTPRISGGGCSKSMEHGLSCANRTHNVAAAFIRLVAFNNQEYERRGIACCLQKTIEFLSCRLIIGMQIISPERITAGASASNELRIGGKPPILASPNSFLRCIRIALHPRRFNLLATHDNAYGTAKSSSDQGCCRTYPEFNYHAGNIWQRAAVEQPRSERALCT